MHSLPEFSPNVVISHLPAWNGERVAVRDDLLQGGTKQRACAPFLQAMRDNGFRHFIYASPFSGFAQIALAYVCGKLDLECTIICEQDKRFPGAQKFHPFSLLAQSHGARLIMASNLSAAEERASLLEQEAPESFKIPLGFDCDEFKNNLEKELRVQWKVLEGELRGPIKNLWLPLGSGTLAKTFHRIVPSHIKIKCVNVHVLPKEDQRIKTISEIERVSIYSAPMLFHEAALDLPSIPSNIFYDAKLWNFINREGEDQDVWWNVAQ
jgi:hypothetical protein